MYKKRHILTTILLVISLNVTAQSGIQKGEQNVSFSLSFGSANYLNNSLQGTSGSTMEIGAGISYTHFVTDRIALTASIGVPYANSPVNGSNNLFSTEYGIRIAPEIGIYFPLNEKLFWVMSTYFSFGLGNYTEDISGGGKFEADYTCWQIGIVPAGIEFRASEKISLDISLGSFSLISTSMTASGSTLKINQNRWKINAGSVGVHIWF